MGGEAVDEAVRTDLTGTGQLPSAGCKNCIARSLALIDHDLSFPIVLTLAVLILIFWLAGWLPFRDTHHSATLIERLDHRLGRISTPTIILLVALGLLWFLLFGLTLAAAFSSILAFHDDPTKGGLGLGAILAGLLGGPFLIWTTVIKQTTLNFQKEGHITDRISKAVEQLGAEKTVKVPKEDATGSVERTVPNIEVRIGGLLSLERIAQDSTRYDNGRDHVRVMEILCAYVRENAPCLTLAITEPDFTAKRMRIDVQTAINVIKRRAADQRAIEDLARYRLDLRSVDFDGADLSRGNFAGAIFWRSRFEAANFERSDLTGAQISGSLLNFAKWYGATLRGTSLDYCVCNRPIPVAGGMNFQTLRSGDCIGVSVLGADLTAIDYFGEDPATTFGAKDTRLCYEMAEMRALANKTSPARRSAKFRNDAEKLAALDAELAGNPFLHWMPFDSSDLTAGHHRAERFKELGLTGWPFED